MAKQCPGGTLLGLASFSGDANFAGATQFQRFARIYRLVHEVVPTSSSKPTAAWDLY